MILDFFFLYIGLSVFFVLKKIYLDTRIWCNWCSIADFSSVRTGSSPVIRYLLLSTKKHGKTNHYWIGCSWNRLSSRLFFFNTSGNVWKHRLAWKEFVRYKKWFSYLWFWNYDYLIFDFVWCDSYYLTCGQYWMIYQHTRIAIKKSMYQCYCPFMGP